MKSKLHLQKEQSNIGSTKKIQWYIPNCSDKKLQDLGFRYSPKYCGYVYRFPVFKNRTQSEISCRFLVIEDEDKKNKYLPIRIDVYLENTGYSYPPFYNREDQGDAFQMILNVIDKNINSELNILKAKKVKGE